MTPIVAPPYPTLELTSTNAAEAVAIALRALEETPRVASYTVFVLSVLTSSTGGGPASFSCPAPISGSNRIHHYDIDRNGAISQGDILTTEFVPCTGTTGTLVIRPKVVDFAAARFEARVEFISHFEDGDEGVASSFDLVSTLPGAPREQTLSDIGVYVKENGDATWITAGAIDLGAPGIAGSYSYSYAADVASSKLGHASYRLATTPLRGRFGAVPSEGEIVVAAAPAQVRITPTTDPADRDDMASLELDATGSGQYGSPAPLPWARVLRPGNLFAWFPNTRPRITRLEITPPNPHRLDTLVPSFDATDADGDRLSVPVFWSINGAWFPQPSETLPPGSFVRGDVVEMRLLASDGQGGLAERSFAFTIGNAPPLATATITPAAPLSVQNLALSSIATDPDGDALSMSYAWRVDGVLVAGESTAMLGHTAHAKNDVVTGIVSVSDGVATTAAEASVTVLDSPGDVAVSSPPTGVSYGDTVTFTAVATDYDGDDTSTRDFRLVYGPAGMSVHPRTGVVSWTARTPMFEPTLRVNFAVSIEEPGASIATGSFVVDDPGRRPPLARGAAFHPHYDGIRIGDFDGNGSEEALLIGYEGVYELAKASGPGYRQTWASFLAFGTGASPSALAAGDVDGDDLAEIFVAHGDTIVRYSGTDRTLSGRVELALPGDHWCGELELADLDRNGTQELLCLATYGDPIANPSTMFVLAADSLDVTKQYPLALYGGFMAVANVDDDAALELTTSGGYVFDGMAVTNPANFSTQWRYAPGFGWRIEAGDVNGDGVADIVGLDLEADAIRAFDARTQAQRWSTTVAEEPIALHVADVTGDAAAEILVGAYWTGVVTAYRQTGATTVTPLFAIEYADEGVGAIATGNLDADGGIEILAAAAGFLGVADPTPAPAIEWLRGDGSTLEASSGFLGGDRLGTELVYLVGASDGQQRFARFDTTDGEIALGSALGNWGDFDAGFALVDYDDDGDTEALLATEDVGNVETRLLAFDFSSDGVEWSNAAGTAEGGPADVAYGDFTDDGRDDLVVLTESGALRVFDLAENTLVYERPGAGPAASVAAADLDGDGVAEILAAIDNRVVAFSRTPTGFAVTATSSQFFGLLAMEVTDIDGDGAHDIFVLYREGIEPPRLARLDASLLLRSEATLAHDATHMMTEGSSFARKNLVFWRRDFTSDLFAADPVTGAEVWRAPRFNGFIGPDSVRFHDFASTGDWSISVGNGVGATLTR